MALKPDKDLGEKLLIAQGESDVRSYLSALRRLQERFLAHLARLTRGYGDPDIETFTRSLADWLVEGRKPCIYGKSISLAAALDIYNGSSMRGVNCYSATCLFNTMFDALRDDVPSRVIDPPDHFLTRIEYNGTEVNVENTIESGYGVTGRIKIGSGLIVDVDSFDGRELESHPNAFLEALPSYWRAKECFDMCDYDRAWEWLKHSAKIYNGPDQRRLRNHFQRMGNY